MAKDNLIFESLITIGKIEESGITLSLTKDSLITDSLVKSSFIGIEDDLTGIGAMIIEDTFIIG